MDQRTYEQEILECVKADVATGRATMSPVAEAGSVTLEGEYPDTRVRVEVVVRDRGRQDIVEPLWCRAPDGKIDENGDLLMEVSLRLLESQ